jgi:hypothetical protein
MRFKKPVYIQDVKQFCWGIHPSLANTRRDLQAARCKYRSKTSRLIILCCHTALFLGQREDSVQTINVLRIRIEILGIFFSPISPVLYRNLFPRIHVNIFQRDFFRHNRSARYEGGNLASQALAPAVL